MLVASGGTTPRLLQTDASARLLASANLNVLDPISQSSPINGSNVFVTNPSLFSAGSYIYCVPGTGGALRISGPLQVLSVVGKQLQVTPTLLDTYGPGDLVLSLPPLVAELWFPDGRPVDLTGLSEPGPTNNAAVSLAGNVKQRARLAYLDATLQQTGATGIVNDLIVWDGPVGTGVAIWRTQLAVSGTVNTIDRFSSRSLRLASSKGNALSASLVAGAVGVAPLISMGVWLD